MHTPGPWAEDEKHTGGARAIIGDGQQLVALVYGRTAEEQAANAKLIAAAMWQPIETAPRDGTTIDLWVSGEFPARYENCYFGKPHHECYSQYCDSCPEDMNVDAWRWHFFSQQIKPSHWRPVPTGPEPNTPETGQHRLARQAAPIGNAQEHRASGRRSFPSKPL